MIVAGYLALLHDLEFKTAKGMTLGRIMRVWNANGARYAAIVARETGIGEGICSDDLAAVQCRGDGVRLLIGAAAAIGFAWQCAYIRRDL